MIKKAVGKDERVLIQVNPGESHPEQRGHGSSRESRGEPCEDRKGFPRWGKSLSFAGTYLYQCLTRDEGLIPNLTYYPAEDIFMLKI